MPKQKVVDLVVKKSFFSLNLRTVIGSFLAVFTVTFVPLIFAHTYQSQFIVGPIVNATLILACLRLGLANALFIAIIPSFIALYRGMLPPQAVVVLPFILLGNFIMITSVFFLKLSLYKKVFLGSFLKMAVVSLPLLIDINLPSSLVLMLSWPQLFTALLGGLAAIKIHRFLNR